ncbi:hypothetical protein SDC9_134069 [bioreactor metagenome]|uniref:Flagellar M-ring C-terminal domain-containing protein n=1 Tax=bioreactor metagenome TaxID=1076179 RepID=A0A645DBZ9_9ZZZZ
MEQVEKSGYEIRDITVAVLIGKKELNSGEIASYKQMVAFAAGVSPDKVVITNAVFASSETSATPDLPETLEEIPKEKMIYLAAAGVFALLLIILIMIMLLGKRRKKKRLEEEESYVPGGPLDPKLKIQPIPGEIVLNETREQGLKRQIKDFSSASPEIVAQLIRTWIKEDDDN